MASFAELVQTCLLAVCAEQHEPYTKSIPIPARKESNVLIKAKERLRAYCPSIYIVGIGQVGNKGDFRDFLPIYLILVIAN